MKNIIIRTVENTLLIFAIVSSSFSQNNGRNVYWHIDPSVKSCSMVIDPALTQTQWKTFVKQVGAITSLKSLATAEPLGAWKFNIGIHDSYTPIDQHNLAWINTFTHPDENCPLGDAVTYPVLRARMGVSDDMEIGAHWTTAPGANYGMAGGEFKYKFSQESEKLPAAAVRGSFLILTGVPDFNLSIYSIDVIASKKIAMFTSYAGFRANLAIGTETTSKVNLASERIFIPQGYAGVSYSIWILDLSAEYNISTVNTFAFITGFNF